MSLGLPSSPCATSATYWTGSTRRGSGSRRSRRSRFPELWIEGERADATRASPRSPPLTGLKSPWRVSSTNVAELAEAAAWRLGLPAESVTLVRRAALAQRPRPSWRVERDLGETRSPRVRGMGAVRLHPHFSERAFAQSSALAPIGRLAGSHHERLDGSGYHRGTSGTALDLQARILAAADCYSAMREARPHRPALDAYGRRGCAAA